MSYAASEMSERLRRVYAPSLARGGMCKQAISKAARDLGVKYGRAFNLFFGRAKPTVEEMDFVRGKEGVWCLEEKKAKPDLHTLILERLDAGLGKIESKIEGVRTVVQKAVERKRAEQSVVERMYQDNRA